MNIHRGSLLPAFLFFTILVLAGCLRLQHLDDSLWLDELHTAWAVAADLGEVPQRAAIGNQSPLYFGAIWMVVQVWGPSELSLRLPSVLAGVLLVAAAGGVAYRWTGRRSAACLAAWLLAIDPTCLFYSQEARPYAWVQLVGLLQAAVFFGLLERPTAGRRIAWIGLSLWLYYLHYTAALLVVAEGFAWLLLWAWNGIRGARHPGSPIRGSCPRIESAARGAAKAAAETVAAETETAETAETAASPRGPFVVGYRPRQLAGDGLVLLLGWLPAAGHLWEIAHRRENWTAFVSQRPFSELATAFFPVWLSLTLPAMCLAAAAGFIWMGRRIAPRGARASRTGQAGQAGVVEDGSAAAKPGGRNGPVRASRLAAAAVLCLCGLFVPLLLTWSATRTGLAPLFFIRYVLVATAAPPLLAAIAVGFCPSAYWRAVICLVVAAAAVHQSGLAASWTRHGRLVPDRNQDWRAAIAWVNRQAADSAGPVLIRSGLIESDGLRSDPGDEALRGYCLLPVNGLYPLSVAASRQIPLPLRSSGRWDASVRERVQTAGRAWLLLAGSPRTVEQILAEVVEGWPAGRPLPRVAEQRSFGSVAAARLEMP